MQRNHRLIRLVFLVGILVVPHLLHAQQTKKRPNILWIVSEDNAPFLSCYGYPDANTPNLDRLATQGILYQNAFASAPVCAPARSSIITGMYPPCIGTQNMRSKNPVDPKQFPFFVKYLKDAGYYCSNNSKTDYNLSPYQRSAWNMMRRGQYNRRKRGQPFFAIYNVGISHESSLHKPLNENLFKAKVTIPPYHPDTPEIRANWAMYHRIITRMDKRVGELLNRLKRDGLQDDTIVFYYADHGGILPRSKRFLFDTGVHVPMIVRFGKNFAHLAKQKPNTKTDRLVSFVDLAPTVLSLAGIQVPSHMQGQAFLGRQATPPRSYVYFFRDRMDERYDMMRAVRDKRFKYIRNYNPHRIYGQHLNYLWRMPATRSWEAAYKAGKCKGPQRFFWEPKPAEELYDTKNDPWEVNNLANNPKYRNQLDRLRGANAMHMLAIRDSGFLPEGEMISRASNDPIYTMANDPKRYQVNRTIIAAEFATRKSTGIDDLMAMVKDSDSAIRYWGVVGLTIQGKKAASAKAILAQLAKSDTSGDVQVAACEALVKLGQTKLGVNQLRKLLKHQNFYVKLRAINVLEVVVKHARPALGDLETVVRQNKGGYLKRSAEHVVQLLQKP